MNIYNSLEERFITIISGKRSHLARENKELETAEFLPSISGGGFPEKKPVIQRTNYKNTTGEEITCKLLKLQFY